jgi:AraC-like DNA-binding protein
MQPAVENRRVYSYAHCELNLFETSQQAEAVPLTFDHLTLMSMTKGKKIMHMDHIAPFDYLAGESLIVPGGQTMHIDYPDADLNNPTQCIALMLEESFLQQTFSQMESYSLTLNDPRQWTLPENACYFVNSAEITALVGKIARLSLEHMPMNELRVELSLKELIVMLAQQQHLSQLEAYAAKGANNDHFTYVMHFIRQHLSEKISIEKLSRMACMSRTNFFKAFKTYCGLSPADYIVRERISLARQLLPDHTMSIAEIAYQTGFNNIPYFIRQFRKQEGVTPGEYRLGLTL